MFGRQKMVCVMRSLFHILSSKCQRYKTVPANTSALKAFQSYLHNKPVVILGIESSCDDTGCGIVDSNGTILSNVVESQHLTHLNHGGIVPTIARDMHTSNITSVCETALKSANLRLRDIDAVAATVKPGLPSSLKVGVNFAKYLSRIGKKPFIPIHHMKAHALMARMTEKVAFPYLVLLISGGHCLLAIVDDVDKFYLLGTSLDNAPGEVLDKMARRLKLRNIPKFSNLSGGQAIEMASQEATNIDQFPFPPTMTTYRNCQFSFSGMINIAQQHIKREEAKHNIVGDSLIPDAYNLSAAFQLALVTHVCQRTQRAMAYIDELSLIPLDKRSLVVSGGVACNNFLARALGILCSELGYNFVRTPPKLCTDNGVMIAWNGIERWMKDISVIRDENAIEEVNVEKKAPLGEDWSKKVEGADLKCKWIKLRRQLL